MKSVKPSNETIKGGLAKAKKRLERRPNSWTSLESVGRCLHWLGDSEATAYFRKAIDNFKGRENDPSSHLRLGNLYRLSGNEAKAQPHFQKARDLYALRTYQEDPSPLSIEHMIPASFLVGNDDEVADLIARLRSIDSDTDLIVYPIAKLAAARRSQDPGLTKEAVTEIASMIRRTRTHVSDTGGVTLWDWYEVALDMYQSLTGEDLRTLSPSRGPAVPPAVRLRTNLLYILAESRQATAWSPDGALLAGTDGSNVLVWLAEDGRLLHTLTSHVEQMSSFAFSPISDILACIGTGGTVQLWHARSGELLRTLREPIMGSARLAFDPTGQLLASFVWAWQQGSDRRALRLWRVEDGQELWSTRGSEVLGAYWSPDGELIATGVKKVHLYRATDGRLAQTLAGHPEEYELMDLAWSPDGRLLATGANDMEIRLWEVMSGRLLHRLRRHTDAGVSDLYLKLRVAFSPDGRVLASAGPDGSVCLWRPADGALLHELLEHEEAIESIDWHPGGRILASAGLDGLVLLWSTEDGHLIERMEAHEAGVEEIAWSLDGRRLTSLGSYDKATRVWQVAVDAT